MVAAVGAEGVHLTLVAQANLPEWGPVADWIHAHLTVIILVGTAIALVGFILALLFTWLSSRGRFMFLDGVARNRGAVVEPWHEYRTEGNSLFAFRICLGLFSLLVIALIVGLGVLVSWSDIQRQQIGPAGVGAIILGAMMIFGFGLVMAVIGLFLRDFVVPIMYINRVRVMQAWREFHGTMLEGNAGTFVLYVLMKMGLAVATGMVAMVLVLATCCIAVIPFVGSVILLPVLVFLQAYPLYFIAQFGPKWNVFEMTAPPPVLK